MKILFITVFLIVQIFNVSAQDNINISFEADEGFELGQLNGQNNWIVSLLEFYQFVTVDDQKSTEGDWSLHLEGDPSGPMPDDLLAIVLGPILTNNLKTQLSVDLYIEDSDNLNSSILNIATEATSQNMLSSRIAFKDGEISIVDINPDNSQQIVFIPVVSYPTNTWFEFKIKFNTNNDQIQYFLDEVLIYTGEIFGSVKFDAFFFASSFNQTGYFIDNINISEETMSVEEATFEGFSFHPNPAKDVININNNQVIQQVEILDITGKKVSTFKNPSSQINVSQLKAGNYFLKVQLEESHQTFKFIKE